MPRLLLEGSAVFIVTLIISAYAVETFLGQPRVRLWFYKHGYQGDCTIGRAVWASTIIASIATIIFIAKNVP